MPCPSVAKTEIEDLIAQGYPPNLDEIAELIELGNRLELPHGRTNPLASRTPISVGTSGLLLPPLTLQAEMWLELYPEQLRRLGAAMIGFASYHGGNAGAFEKLNTWRAIVEAVEAWESKLLCTAEELVCAADVLTGKNEPESAPSDPDARANMADILAEVAVESGQPLEYWLTHTSGDLLRAMEAIGHKRAAAVGAEINEANEDAQRLRDVMWAAERVRERYRNEAKHGA